MAFAAGTTVSDITEQGGKEPGLLPDRSFEVYKTERLCSKLNLK
jgi:hypothetical protein